MVEEKQLILHEEGRMDDAITFARSQEEEARTAGVIRAMGMTIMTTTSTTIF